MGKARSSEPVTVFPKEARSAFRKAILNWYDRNGRQLPWRVSADPYRIWLSEIMLQQTTVAAVVPYFERFSAECPDVATLAATPLDRVMRLWEGLGYYSRARNLHRAAQAIMTEFGGQIPEDLESLQSLPGIGRYTAGAVASFAFNRPAPIVEANTERLYARLMALPEDVRSTASQKRLWQFAEEIVPSSRAGDFNQALMDIGSQVCTPATPLCDDCPVRRWCRAASEGTQHEIPRRKARTAITPVCEVAIAIRYKDSWCLRRRSPEERWAGMWDFLRQEVPETTLSFLPSAQSGSKAPRKQPALFDHSPEFPRELHEMTQPYLIHPPGTVNRWTEFSYSVTRYKVRLAVLECVVDRRVKLPDNFCWAKVSDFEALPLSMTGRRIANWLVTE